MDWTWIISFLAYLSSAFAYYHLKSERTFSLPTNPGAVFGFSVSSVSSGPSARLLVGAPLADHTGVVYTCDLSNPANTCESAKKPPIPRFVENKNYADLNYWYGATVMGTSDHFVACAPLLIDKDSSLFVGNPVGTFGRCVLYEKQNTPTLLRTMDLHQRKANHTKFENIMDSFGWSLDVDADGTILIGSPAMITGRVLKLTTFNSRSVLYMTGDISTDKFNFGSSVAYGKILGTKRNDKSIVIGSTYGRDGEGRVTIIQDKLKKQIRGPKVGFMFGASLCPAKLMTKGEDSLLVGAPAYSTEDTYNTGAVYVYYVNAKKMLVQKTIITGETSNSFFGFAIISLGDLDNDKIDEIAISAPYYKEHGAVYLYRGADIMKNAKPRPMQVIEPEAKIRSFGYSLSVLRDYDDNGCNELAIGAPDSNTVKVFRCLAGITIDLMKLPATITGTNGLDKTEELNVCFTAKFPVKPVNVKADININVEFDHKGVSGGGDVLIKLRKKSADPYCETVDMRMSSGGNFDDKIKYTLTATLKNDPSRKSDFSGDEVILNKQSIKTLTDSIWAQECGNKKCSPKLTLETTYKEKSPYTIGSSSSINANMLVKNTGDVAYDACLRVKVSGAAVSLLPGCCTQLESDEADVMLLCKPQQLLRRTIDWNTDLALDTTQLTNENKEIAVNISLYNECSKEVVTDSHEKVYQLIAVTDSIQVHGRTDDGITEVVNLKKSDIAARKSFEQVYTISNSGPTNWVNIPISITVQNQDFLATSIHIEDQVCNSDNTTGSDYHCVVMKLDRDAGIDVKVHMQPISDDLSDALSKHSVTVYSKIEVVLDDIHKVANVTTELKLVEGKVPIWIIIVASILALIILLIIFFILRECGLLERKNKKNLQDARRSVRRQTVMRQSMMNRPLSNDQRNLVADEGPSQEIKKKRDRRVVVNDF